MGSSLSVISARDDTDAIALLTTIRMEIADYANKDVGSRVSIDTSCHRIDVIIINIIVANAIANRSYGDQARLLNSLDQS